ncbi:MULTISPECIES: sensor histidine kinase [unclassified Streptomyces]|uniref:sensor histidine kinase n=1 Tax=unclassified Streptomyces TaxID=2593676 RepID=UPI00382D6C22
MKAAMVGSADGESAEAVSQELPPRKAMAITAGVLIGFFVIDGSFVWAQRPPVWESAVAVLAFAAIMGLQLGHSFPWLFPRLTQVRYAAWVFQILPTYLPLALFGEAWGGMSEFLAASAVLVFPTATGWALFSAVIAADFVEFHQYGLAWGDVVYASIEAILIPLVLIGLSRMSAMISQLHRSRAELSRLAVAAERLRFARDLHDVLGFSLSAITLKCELAYRLFTDAPAKAQEELTEILGTSRKALADVRSVSRGYREMSLWGEADAAVSMLGAAGIRTTVHIDRHELPGAVDTMLATVLREGLTNLLRHSKAEQCQITVERRGRDIAFTLANDGVRSGRQPKGGPDGGLAALDERVRLVGGTLSHRADDGWFRLCVTVALPDCGDAAAGSAPATACPDDPEQPPAARPRGAGHLDVAPRDASAITLAVLVGYFLACSAEGWSFAPAGGFPRGVELCLLALLALQLTESFHWRFSWAARYRTRLRYGALGLQAVFQFLPFLAFGRAWPGIPGFLAGSALLVLPAVAAWPALLIVTAASDAALYASGVPLQDVIYETAYTPICALVVFGLSRMAQLASELHRSRSEIARLAVTTERLRFARDLHDLLGFSLSAITLKCELVRRLGRTRPMQAQEELTEVLQIARQALADVRTVADGRQRMSLAAEAESATAMLAGVGIRATVDTDCGELPGDVDTVLATMLREGLTNMLRHSRAAHCKITAERTAAGVRLTLVNDGVDGCAAPGLDSKVNGGSGIGNLTTRVNAVNGRLMAGARPDGWFELRAEVELLAA